MMSTTTRAAVACAMLAVVILSTTVSSTSEPRYDDNSTLPEYFPVQVIKTCPRDSGNYTELNEIREEVRTILEKIEKILSP